MKAIVFTDLDGTLLDHHSYDWSPARPALAALEARGVPVVFNSSKTAEECRQLQVEMGLRAPFIVENGSCIHHDDDRRVLGESRRRIVATLERLGLAQQFRYRSFSELGVTGIQRSTGLSRERAALAASRQYSEPLLWEDSAAAVAQLADQLAPEGLRLLQGGRFVHVIGDCDKGRAAEALLATFSQRPRVVALGDRPNDVDLLRMADQPIWVRSPKGLPPGWREVAAGVRCTEQTGPAGWNAAILSLIAEGQI